MSSGQYEQHHGHGGDPHGGGGLVSSVAGLVSSVAPGHGAHRVRVSTLSKVTIT